MIHALKIENDNIVLDVEEILQYPLLQQIYARDTSKNKDFAYKEFRFIHFLTDRKGYITKAGLSKIEAQAYARENSNLPPSYKPDKVIIEAIEFVRSQMNITPVEDLINSTIKALNLSGRVVKALTDGIETLTSGDIKLEDLQACEESLKQIIRISNEIPDRVEKLTELQEKWDKIEKGVTSIRGGGDYSESYDGVNERTPGTTDEVEILR